MKRKYSIALAVIAVVAAGAISAAGAGAATLLTLRDSTGVVPVGTAITATSHNLVFSTSAGNLECETDELEGLVKSNGAAKDLGTINETEAKGFGSRNFGDYLGNPGACKTSAAGPVIITTAEYPWSIEFKYVPAKGAGEAVVKSSGATKKVSFTSEFLALEGPNNRCTFEDAKIPASFAVGAAGHPVTTEITATNALFKLNKKAPRTAPICPKEGKLSGLFLVEDSHGVVSSEI